MYKPNFYNDDIDLLLEALLLLENKEEFMRFLEDVCTIKEIQDMGQRFWLLKNCLKENPIITLQKVHMHQQQQSLVSTNH